MSTIGFDTSNYTTSTAWTDGKTDINVRQILYVKDGERGIRQSDGVFQHMKLMPVMYEKLSEQIDFKDVKAVGVSTRPRCVEGSYMPVFLAGEGYAKVVANTLGVPLYEFSHQDGHIMAGIYSSGSFELLENDFISVHLSGGTTEILKSRYNGFNFDNEIVGGSKDISAGQFIDRVGVKMGLHFPAGKALEQLALKTEKGEKLPLLTSCCPAWVKFITDQYQEFIPNLSTCRSPQGMMSAVIKEYFRDPEHAAGKKTIMVSVMPCTAKKAEAVRPNSYTHGEKDTDIVITTTDPYDR